MLPKYLPHVLASAAIGAWLAMLVNSMAPQHPEPTGYDSLILSIAAHNLAVLERTKAQRIKGN